MKKRRFLGCQYGCNEEKGECPVAAAKCSTHDVDGVKPEKRLMAFLYVDVDELLN